MKELTVRENDAGQRLDRFVAKAVPLLPDSLLQKYIRLKRIKLNGRGAKRDVRLAAGDAVQLYINDEFFEKPREDNAWLKVGTPRLTIVYEDENLLLLDKKPGVLCHSAGVWDYNTLIANVQAYLAQKGEWRPREEHAFAPALCNRIDRNTGGIVIAAKNAEALRILNEKNQVFVRERPEPGTRTAVTEYRTLSSRGALSLVECRLLTGRTHQIRVQMAHAGWPLLGDGKYGSERFNRDFGEKGQALYSYRLRFDFPTDAGALDYLRGREFRVERVDFAEKYFGVTELDF